ncbi:MAG: hypothetical protein O7I93_08430 [Gemmatimonadetes bacterium]|nr:hypothetical protein [Gemmatimonadota bacterium]
MRRHLALLAAMLALAGCDTRQSGELVYSLATPNGDDGAVQFTIQATPGYEIIGVTTSCSACELFTRRVSDLHLRAVITGPIGSGPLLRVKVSDLETPRVYTVQIVQVASRGYELRSTAGYSLTLLP